MAKIQPVMQEFNTMAAPNATQDELANATEAAARKISRPKRVVPGEVVVSDMPVIKGKNKLAAAEEKAGAAEAIERQNVRLTKENAQLTEKLAEYIDELDKLRRQVKEPKVVEKIVEKIVEKPVEVVKEAESSGYSVEIAKLRDEVKKLQAENDEYLMKISELTFENAKLTSAMHEIQKVQKQAEAANAVQRENRFPNCYRNSDRLNGYSSWN